MIQYLVNAPDDWKSLVVNESDACTHENWWLCYEATRPDGSRYRRYWCQACPHRVYAEVGEAS